MGCKSKYRDNEASGLQEGCSSVSQGRALEPAGDRRSREMTVAPQGEQNPAYSSESSSDRKSRFGGTSRKSATQANKRDSVPLAGRLSFL